MNAIGSALSGITGAANAANGITSTASSIANIIGPIGAGMKALGGVVGALTGEDDKQVPKNKLTPDQTGVADDLAQKFGLSSSGQPFSGAPGLGAGGGAGGQGGLSGRVNRLVQSYRTIQPPQSNRFNLAGR